MSKSSSIAYRADIDGLRALAIIPVVWYHAGLPGLPGGFTGVDTFFVISGFLISAIIQREVTAGTFTFAGFYQRRLRRIAPALLLVVSTTLAVGTLLLLPYELSALSASALAAIFMVPNIHFWTEAGYFALGAEYTPLLHTWSLGVEEQFYLLFPVALLIVSRLKLFGHRALVIAIFLISLALCVWATPKSPSAAFYLLPTRAWELMAGAMIALGVFTVPDRLKAATSLMGLALIVSASLFISSGDLFPGYLALIPVAGAALIITAGENAPVNRALAAKPFVWLGARSYSLYLWHWPVFVFMRHTYGDLTPTLAIGGILISLALTELTFRFVEEPFRRGMKMRSVALITAPAVAVLLGAILVTSNGLPNRWQPAALAALDARNDTPPGARDCLDAPIAKAWADCRFGAGPTAIVWGDSHAAANGASIGNGFSSIILASNTCAPTAGWVNPRRKGDSAEACRSRNADVLARALSDDVQMVDLSAYWPKEADPEFWPSLQAVVDQLTGKRIVVLAGVPQPEFDVPRNAALAIGNSRKPKGYSCPPADIPLRGVEIVDVSKAFCAHPAPLSLFTDSNHISWRAGQEIISPAFAKLSSSNAR